MAKIKKPDFDAYYTEIFPERWPALREAMEKPSTHAELSEGLLKPYYLDRASIFPVDALEPGGAKKILDLCAAPGGKSLAISCRMDGDASFTVNDRSGARRGRLRRVMDEHLPEDIRSRITVTGHDASRWGLYEQNLYDRILADVPCSSERHLVQEPAHLKNWTPARTRHLSVQAYAILAAAFTALKPGGRLVYSTCAISPAENDLVIAKLLKKKGDECQVLDFKGSGEETEYGRIILPDTCEGMGPIFYACISKE